MKKPALVEVAPLAALKGLSVLNSQLTKLAASNKGLNLGCIITSML